MALLRTLNYSGLVSVIIWKIEETEEDLLKHIKLHPSDRARFETLKHPAKRKEFLALRCCLREFFGYNPEVHYMNTGKPFIKKKERISFSHTQGYAGMIISPEVEVGIDLEVIRESIKKIAPKYMRKEEYSALHPETEVPQLLHYWGAKEVMVKITGNRKLDFRKELRVAPFCYRKFQQTTGIIIDAEGYKKVKLCFKTLDQLHLSFGWKV